jgi:anti-sigma factor RsiW
MNCDEAQAFLFDSLDRPTTEDRRLDLEIHLASCDACRALADTHRRLDARLRAAIPQLKLNPQFRMRLRARMRRRVEWPDYLPDVAHLFGCAAAVGLLLVFLPEYRERVAMLGAGFTVVSYFSQAVLRGVDT